MAHTVSSPEVSSAYAGTLIAAILACALGFALGQAWSDTSYTSQSQIESDVEDWHGNVRRSTWPD